MAILNLVSLPSARVSPQTRQVLEDRLDCSHHEKKFFNEIEFRLLKMLADCVLPQAQSGTAVPIASAIDFRLAKHEGLGWRYAVLPPEPEAYRQALRAIAPLTADSIEDRAELLLPLLSAIQRKEHDTPDFPLSLWLETFKNDAVRYWLAHPETMALMTYEGFADNRLTPRDTAPNESSNEQTGESL